MYSTHLIVIVKIDPTTKTLNGLAPFRRESHDNSPAIRVVLFNSELLDGLQTGHAELFVDFVLDGNSMTIPWGR